MKIKRGILVFNLVLFLAGLLCVSEARGQTLRVEQFPGTTIGDRVRAAQTSCNATIACVLIIPPEMSSFSIGTYATFSPNTQVTVIDYATSPGTIRFRMFGSSSDIFTIGGAGTQSLAITAAVSFFSALTASFNGAITDGTALKHDRVTTGAIAGATRADVTLTWAGTAFANTSYTTTCTVVETSASGLGLRVERIRSVTTTTVVVQVMNDNAGALTGTLNCVALHD